MKITIEGVNQDQLDRYSEIFSVLINTGSLDGIKGGSTILHFDKDGIFMGIEHDYWPWRRRKTSRMIEE